MLGGRPAAPWPAPRADALAAGLIQALGLDQGKGDLAIEQRVVSEIDALLAALAEEGA